MPFINNDIPLTPVETSHVVLQDKIINDGYSLAIDVERLRPYVESETITPPKEIAEQGGKALLQWLLQKGQELKNV